MFPPTPVARVRRRPPLLRAATAATLAFVVAVAAACASEASRPDVQTVDEFEATVAYLDAVAERSTAEGYHVEMYMSMTGNLDGTTTPMLAGEVEGVRYHYLMDLEPVMREAAEAEGEPIPPGLFAAVDMTMEMAGDDEVLYLRAPMFSDQMMSDPSVDAGGMDRLGDGWGVVDVTALGDQLPTEAANALTSQGVDPRAVVEMIQDADDVEELGADVIGSTDVRGLAAETTMAALLDASGTDPGELAGMLGSADGTADIIDELYNTTTSIEVWIDDDGYLRRMEFGWSFADLADAAGEDPRMLAAMGLADLAFEYRVDLSDFGTTVDFVEPTDAVDITDDYARLF